MTDVPVEAPAARAPQRHGRETAVRSRSRYAAAGGGLHEQVQRPRDLAGLRLFSAAETTPGPHEAGFYDSIRARIRSICASSGGITWEYTLCDIDGRAWPARSASSIRATCGSLIRRSVNRSLPPSRSPAGLFNPERRSRVEGSAVGVGRSAPSLRRWIVRRAGRPHRRPALISPKPGPLRRLVRVVA